MIFISSSPSISFSDGKQCVISACAGIFFFESASSTSVQSQASSFHKKNSTFPSGSAVCAVCASTRSFPSQDRPMDFPSARCFRLVSQEELHWKRPAAFRPLLLQHPPESLYSPLPSHMRCPGSVLRSHVLLRPVQSQNGFGAERFRPRCRCKTDHARSDHCCGIARLHTASFHRMKRHRERLQHCCLAEADVFRQLHQVPVRHGYVFRKAPSRREPR